MEKKVPERKVSLREEDIFYVYDKRINKCIKEECEGTVKYGLVFRVNMSGEETCNCFECNKCHMKYTPYPNYVRLTKTDMMKIYNQEEVDARDRKRAEDALKQAARDRKKQQGQSRFAPRKNNESKSYQGRPYDNRSYNRKPYGNKPFDRKPYEKKSYGFGSYENNFSDRKPYERKLYGTFSNENSSYGRKSYDKSFGDRKPYEGKAYERKPYGERRNSNNTTIKNDNYKKSYPNKRNYGFNPNRQESSFVRKDIEEKQS